MDSKLEQAKQLILNKQYTEARAILRSMRDDATASKWLAKLDEINPESVSEKLAVAKLSFEQGDIRSTRELVRLVIHEEPSAEASVLAAKATTDREQQIKYLENALALDLFHDEAHQMLQELKGVQPTSNKSLELDLGDSEIASPSKNKMKQASNDLVAQPSKRSYTFLAIKLACGLIVMPCLICIFVAFLAIQGIGPFNTGGQKLPQGALEAVETYAISGEEESVPDFEITNAKKITDLDLFLPFMVTVFSDRTDEIEEGWCATTDIELGPRKSNEFMIFRAGEEWRMIDGVSISFTGTPFSLYCRFGVF